MVLLYQIPWSPYCIMQRRILEFGRIAHRLVNVPSDDRSVVWKLTRERYYQVPVIKHGRQVLFEVGSESQVLAKYLSEQFGLNLFPKEWEGVQDVLWRYIEDEVEGVGFRLNDIHWREFVPARERCGFVRHKERRFGVGCLDAWKNEAPVLLQQMEARLRPMERMLAVREFLLDSRPIFVDFCLFGVLSNFLYSGHYELPESYQCLQRWYDRMRRIEKPKSV